MNRFELADLTADDIIKAKLRRIAELPLNSEKRLTVEEKDRLAKLLKARLDGRRRAWIKDIMALKADKIIAKFWLCETVGEAMVILGAVFGESDGILANS